MSVDAPAEALLLNASAAARLLGYSRSKFYELDSQALIPAAIEIGGQRRWSREELQQWIAAKCPPRWKWEAR